MSDLNSIMQYGNGVLWISSLNCKFYSVEMEFCYAVPNCIMLFRIVLCYSELCYAIPNCVMLFRIMLCCSELCYAVPNCELGCPSVNLIKNNEFSLTNHYQQLKNN